MGTPHIPRGKPRPSIPAGHHCESSLHRGRRGAHTAPVTKGGGKEGTGGNDLRQLAVGPTKKDFAAAQGGPPGYANSSPDGGQIREESRVLAGPPRGRGARGRGPSGGGSPSTPQPAEKPSWREASCHVGRGSVRRSRHGARVGREGQGYKGMSTGDEAAPCVEQRDLKRGRETPVRGEGGRGETQQGPGRGSGGRGRVTAVLARSRRGDRGGCAKRDPWSLQAGGGHKDAIPQVETRQGMGPMQQAGCGRHKRNGGRSDDRGGGASPPRLVGGHLVLACCGRPVPSSRKRRARGAPAPAPSVPRASVRGGDGVRGDGRSRKEVADQAATMPAWYTLTLRRRPRPHGADVKRPLCPLLVSAAAVVVAATKKGNGDSGNVCVCRGGRRASGGRNDCARTRQRCSKLVPARGGRHVGNVRGSDGTQRSGTASAFAGWSCR